MFGKSTFYEKSARIPLILAGDGIPAGRTVGAPVSIMDIGPTLLALTGAHPMMDVDGVSLATAVLGGRAPAHTVYGEFMERPDMQAPADRYCFMLRQGDCKYMCFADDPENELLFNVRDDPDERSNLADSRQDVLLALRALAQKIARPEESVALQKRHARTVELLRAYEKAAGADSGELRLDTPARAREYPEVRLKND